MCCCLLSTTLRSESFPVCKGLTSAGFSEPDGMPWTPFLLLPERSSCKKSGKHEDIEISTTAICGQEAQKTNCSFQASCVASRQGWENKKREILPGDKASATTRMMAKQGLGEEKRTFDRVMTIQGQKSSEGCFGQLNYFIPPSLSNRQETDLPVCLGFLF